MSDFHLFDFDDSDDVLEEDNPIFRSDEEGMLLLSQIISSRQKKSYEKRTEEFRLFAKAEHLIKQDLVSCISCLNWEKEWDICVRLNELSNKLKSPEKFRLFGKLSVVGIGGSFSSGKSSFINSFLKNNDIKLPEKQTPTTVVPTYVIRGTSNEFFAYTTVGVPVVLNMEQMNAISHQFYEKYSLNLSGFLSYLSICVADAPEFMTQIAFLDTPGFNNSDSDHQNIYTDNHKAITSLQAIDALIWLVDMDNGTIHKSDIAFIKRLQTSVPLLVVVNKCDMRHESHHPKVISEIKDTLIREGIHFEDVVAYSSTEPEKSPFGVQRILDFLNTIGSNTQGIENISSHLEAIFDEIENAFREKLNNILSIRPNLRSVIIHSGQLDHIDSLLSCYKELAGEIRHLQQERTRFRDIRENIRTYVAQIRGVNH